MTMLSELHNEIDGERLWQDIIENGEIGAVESESGFGRTVLPGTIANKTVRDRFVSKLEDAGLEVAIDSVGNIRGRYHPAGVEKDTSAVASGSHLDSVPRGGIFDGPLGVYGALEAVRAIEAASIPIERPIDVVSFTEEEGHRFTNGLLGSAVVAGETHPEKVLSIKDAEGISVEQALTDIGYKGEDTIRAHDWDSWIELHVEQSRHLTRANATTGIVTGIAGTIRGTIVLTGEANHSGTTSMEERRDAFTAASRLSLALEEKAKSLAAMDGGETVATIGDVTINPGAVNVIPEQAVLRVDIRSTTYGHMKELVMTAENVLEDLEANRNIETSFDWPYNIKPTRMSERCVSALASAATASDVTPQRLHSGAGHDTLKIATVTDAGMLFAPSRDGVSHHPDEWTNRIDCTKCVEVLAGALATLATP